MAPKLPTRVEAPCPLVCPLPLFILLFFFQLSFFLWTKLGLFLLFLFAFIFTSLITHICFPVIENECSSQLRQIVVTFSAFGPFGPRPSVYDTRCPSRSSSKLTPSRSDE